MDSFAELRELKGLFHSGVLALDASTVGCCTHFCATPTTHESDDDDAEELEPFWLRYMVLLRRPCREA